MHNTFDTTLRRFAQHLALTLAIQFSNFALPAESAAQSACPQGPPVIFVARSGLNGGSGSVCSQCNAVHQAITTKTGDAFTIDPVSFATSDGNGARHFTMSGSAASGTFNVSVNADGDYRWFGGSSACARMCGTTLVDVYVLGLPGTPFSVTKTLSGTLQSVEVGQTSPVPGWANVSFAGVQCPRNQSLTLPGAFPPDTGRTTSSVLTFGGNTYSLARSLNLGCDLYLGRDLFGGVCRRAGFVAATASLSAFINRGSAPVAAIHPADTVATPQDQDVLFRNASFDPDGGALTAEWLAVGAQATVAHGDTEFVARWDSLGVFPVRLAVRDCDGRSAAAVTYVSVEPCPGGAATRLAEASDACEGLVCAPCGSFAGLVEHDIPMEKPARGRRCDLPGTIRVWPDQCGNEFRWSCEWDLFPRPIGYFCLTYRSAAGTDVMVAKCPFSGGAVQKLVLRGGFECGASAARVPKQWLGSEMHIFDEKGGDDICYPGESPGQYRDWIEYKYAVQSNWLRVTAKKAIGGYSDLNAIDFVVSEGPASPGGCDFQALWWQRQDNLCEQGGAQVAARGGPPELDTEQAWTKILLQGTPAGGSVTLRLSGSEFRSNTQAGQSRSSIASQLAQQIEAAAIGVGARATGDSLEVAVGPEYVDLSVDDPGLWQPMAPAQALASCVGARCELTWQNRSQYDRILLTRRFYPLGWIGGAATAYADDGSRAADEPLEYRLFAWQDGMPARPVLVSIAKAPEAWPQKGGGPSQLGRANYSVPNGRRRHSFATALWQTPFADSPNYGAVGASSAVFRDDAGPLGEDLVLCSYHWPKGLLAVDRETGRRLWQGNPGGGEQIGDATPAFAPSGSTVYVVNDATESPAFPNGHPLMAIDAATGASVLRHNGSMTQPLNFERTSPIVAPDGRIFAHRWNGGIFAAKDSAGALRQVWQSATSLGANHSEPALWVRPDSSLMVVGSGTFGQAAAFDGAAGAQLWSVQTPGPSDASPTIDPANGTMYLPGGLDDVWVMAVGSSGGQPWPTSATALRPPGSSERARSTGCLSHDGGTYYFQSVGETGQGALYAIRTSNGSLKWRYPTRSQGPGDQEAARPVVTADGIVFVGNNHGGKYFAILDAAGGPIALDSIAVEPGGTARATPTVSPDGRMYLPLRMRWTVSNGSSETPSGVAENLLVAFDLTGSGSIVDVPAARVPPLSFALSMSPNPTSRSRGGCSIRLSLPSAGRCEVQIVDVSGRRIREVANSSLTSGLHSLRWDGLTDAGVPARAGVYFVRAVHGAARASRPIVLLQ